MREVYSPAMLGPQHSTLVTKSSNSWEIQCAVDSIGPDFLCRLTGGDEHVGAVALSTWDGERAHTEVIVAGPHKEGPLAEHSAHKLCTATRRAVTCVCGIHYDDLTQAEIEGVTRTAYDLVKRTADQLRDQRLAMALAAADSIHARIVTDLGDLSRRITTFLATPLATLLEKHHGEVAESHRTHFGGKVLLFAPLYLSNACLNDCNYCGFRRGLKFKRTRLDVEQAVVEAEFLAAAGHRSIDLVTGETPSRTFITYLCDVIRAIREATPIEKINLNLGALGEEDYARLSGAGATGYHLYQETYDPETYFRVHQEGPKRDMEYRLQGVDRAAGAGFRFLGLGVLLGLNDPVFELAALVRHAEQVLTDWPEVKIGFSLPRITAAVGQSEFGVESPVDDETFIKAMLFLRLHFPQAHLTLTTREAPKLRDLLIPLGITKLSAGVSTAPGGYSVAPEGEVPQFSIHDERPLTDVAEILRELGMCPVCS
jgi:2-iminoacetate synthase